MFALIGSIVALGVAAALSSRFDSIVISASASLSQPLPPLTLTLCLRCDKAGEGDDDVGVELLEDGDEGTEVEEATEMLEPWRRCE